MIEKLNVLSNEINMINSICECYFNRMYSNISFALTFYGVIIAASINANVLSDEMISRIVLMYLLPFGTYILGILYCNNVLQIEKTGYIQIKDEMSLKMVLLIMSNNEIGIEGWAQNAKANKNSSLITYGTVFMAYVLAPLLIESLYFYIHFKVKLLNVMVFLKALSVFDMIPMFFYFLYIFLMGILAKEIFKVRKRIKKIQKTYFINNTIINTRPIM